MALQLGDLSIDKIKERFIKDGHLVSPGLLKQLRRDPRQGAKKLHELLKKKYDRDRTERLRLDALLNFERLLWRSGVRHIAGVDEVGMGPLAGPVVAAAVVFPPGAEIAGIDDSKRLEPEVREQLAERIGSLAAAIGVGLADVGDIDRLNIYHAGLLAMRRAIDALPFVPDHILVDSRTVPDLAVPQNAFHKGDGINFSIAAASIVAKTHRDRIMMDLDMKYPGYGFARHKGYATADHQNALRRLGPSAIHRMSFGFIQEVCGNFSALFYELKHELEMTKSRSALRVLEERVEEQSGKLSANEHRKLRLMISRRWKTMQ